MYDFSPPVLETFDHWPGWLNARRHLDRSACFELKVSDVRLRAGCVPMERNRKGKLQRLKGRSRYDVVDLPNERPAVNSVGRLTCGWFDVSAWLMDDLARAYQCRRLSGDWRTGRAPAMRRWRGGDRRSGMTLKQGGYGPRQRDYELERAVRLAEQSGRIGCGEALGMAGGHRDERRLLDAGLEGNPNRGASREKRFGLDDGWVQRVGLEKWKSASPTGVQYFLICPGPGGDPSMLSRGRLRSSVGRKGLKGLTGTTSNCGDGSRGAHAKGWICGQRVYKLFWLLAREQELRDARLAEAWINGLSSGELSRQSAAVSALVQRYGPIMGEDRMLRCRRCLRLRYGQSPELLRKLRRGGKSDRR